MPIWRPKLQSNIGIFQSVESIPRICSAGDVSMLHHHRSMLFIKRYGAIKTIRNICRSSECDVKMDESKYKMFQVFKSSFFRYITNALRNVTSQSISTENVTD